MVIGVPKEIKDHEFRVSVTPDGTRMLLAEGHTVWVEAGAGLGSGFSDEDYSAAGAKLGSKEQVFGEAELPVMLLDSGAMMPRLSRSGLFGVYPRR
jgi:alanine dehydrogenase